jgi:NADPH-dependent 2,4-dienoyl-CoA reductase/sulfur reductase-like enzyme
MILECDVAVAGPGVAPGLVALALTTREPSLRVALVTADAAVGGNDLDLILPQRLPARFHQLLEPLIVAEWHRCLVNLVEGSEVLAEPVELVDPLQLWLQLVERIDPAAMVTGCPGFEHGDGILKWSGGELACAKLIDLSGRRTPERVAELVGAGDLSALDCPVLADLAAAGEHYDHLQYVPLGDGRVVINRFDATAEFHHHRADFAPGSVEALPVLRFWRELGELCSGLLR